MPKFTYRGDIYDFDMVASIKRLHKPVPNKFEPDKPPKTHILRWKNEYVDSEKAKREAWLDEDEAAAILQVWERMGETAFQAPPLRGQTRDNAAAMPGDPVLPTGPVSLPRSYGGRVIPERSNSPGFPLVDEFETIPYRSAAERNADAMDEGRETPWDE